MSSISNIWDAPIPLVSLQRQGSEPYDGVPVAAGMLAAHWIAVLFFRRSEDYPPDLLTDPKLFSVVAGPAEVTAATVFHAPVSRVDQQRDPISDGWFVAVTMDLDRPDAPTGTRPVDYNRELTADGALDLHGLLHLAGGPDARWLAAAAGALRERATTARSARIIGYPDDDSKQMNVLCKWPWPHLCAEQ